MKPKHQCVLVDDEEFALAALKGMIEELDILKVERAYLNPDRFLVDIDSLESKIIFLDLEMPIYGVEVASKLKNKQVIFVSGYTDKAYQTFDVNPVDFVPKPIRLSRLKTAIYKALSSIQTDKIVVKTLKAKRHEVALDEIAYIYTDKKGDSRNKIIHLVDGSTIDIANTKFIEILDQSSKLLQVNPSAIVHIDQVVQVIDTDTIGVRKNNSRKIEEITLGNTYREAFFSLKPHLR